MNISIPLRVPAFLRAGTSIGLSLACAVVLGNAPIVQPGAPGEPAREMSAERAIEIADTGYSPADVRFMQDMIPHHHQAIEMAELAADRTNTQEIIDAAGRINGSQADEIKFMQEWLTERGEVAPEPTAHHAMHTSHKMAGMATPQQMDALASADGTDFDRQFLRLMITHHEGAVSMVDELLEQPGSAYDPTLFEFTSDVTNDQTAEIERMHELLLGLSDDPRAGLQAGFRDAGEAILNMRLVASVGKPPGFFDPANPAGLPAKRFMVDEDDDEEAVSAGEEGEEGAEEEKKNNEDKRFPLLSFANTDIAFREDVMVAGSYHGFNVYQLTDDGTPNLMASIVCPGGQGDVSIVGDLLIMSVEQTRGRVDCGLEGVSEDVSQVRFRGIRIFDISELTRPVQVGAVQTCRGSHTHSVVSGPGDDGKIVIYNSGTSRIREEEELKGCFDESPGDERTALFRIDVIEIPVDDPSLSRVVSSPRVFADPSTGRIAGLWRGGDHGDDTQDTNRTDQCHDITVFPEAGLAAGACSGNGIIFDISDPLNPQRMHEVVDKGFAYWHSATFNNDGTKVLFTDEWGGGGRPRCRAYDPLDWGANAIYDIVDGELEFRCHFKIPAPQGDTENCVAHNGSIVPVPGRDIFVQSWYQGGISIIDFTDSSNPVEIGYFDRGPIDADDLILGGFWSSYWYNGRVYGTEIVRGIDVLELTASEHLTANEIEAAKLANQGQVFNPQQQLKVTWPAEPVVAQAYLDQLKRAGATDDDLVSDIERRLEAAADRLADDSRDRGLARNLARLAERIGENGSSEPMVRDRLKALVVTLNDIAERLRG